MTKIPRMLLADSAMILVGMIWGLNFTLIKYAIGIIPPMEFIGLRFLLAAFALGVIFFKHLRVSSVQEVLAGCIIGVFLALGFLTQTIGLQHTTPGKSGVITSLYMVIVPFIVSVLRQKFVGWIPIGGALLAFAGLCLMSWRVQESLWLSEGDLLSVLCAFAYALHIVAVEHFAARHNPYVLTTVQIAFAGLVSSVYSVFFEAPHLALPAFVWGAVLYTALLGTCFALLVQNLAQQYTSSSHAALLLGLEAPFAMLFSILIWGESLSARSLLGSLMIFAAIVIVELTPYWWQTTGQKDRPAGQHSETR